MRRSRSRGAEEPRRRGAVAQWRSGPGRGRTGDRASGRGGTRRRRAPARSGPENGRQGAALLRAGRCCVGADGSVESCADLCGTTPNGIAVADVRGRQDLDNYLGVRCEHLDSANPCHCAARLGNALDRGLVRRPDHETSLTERTGILPETFAKVGDLYSSLPRVRRGTRRLPASSRAHVPVSCLSWRPELRSRTSTVHWRAR